MADQRATPRVKRVTVQAGTTTHTENKNIYTVFLLFFTKNHTNYLIDRLHVTLGCQLAMGGLGTARSVRPRELGSQ